LAALLLLLTEKGPGSYSQAQLDIEFAARDDDWSGSEEIEIEFRQTVETIKAILDAAVPDFELKNSKLRNQADFYSLFGAIHQLKGESSLPVARDCGLQLGRFLAVLDDAPPSQRHEDITSYYEAARSASSDKGPREERIRIIKRVLLKQLPL
jgi:hypothetical protein